MTEGKDVNSHPKVVTQQYSREECNKRPLDRKSYAMPLRHQTGTFAVHVPAFDAQSAAVSL